MEAKIDYLQVPYDYKICLNKKCSLSSTCLRQLIEQSIPSNIQSWTIISPKYLALQEGSCPFYRSTTKVRFAKGFIKLLENLPHKQMQTVISHLMSHFSRRTYYRVRKGDRLLSPNEQEKVLNIIKKCGVSHPQEFDAYVEDYDW